MVYVYVLGMISLRLNLSLRADTALVGSEIETVDVDRDGIPDISYKVGVARSGHNIYYDFFVEGVNGSKVLVPNSGASTYQRGERIQMDSAIALEGIGLMSFRVVNSPEGTFSEYLPFKNDLSAETNAILGVQIPKQDGWHYGWFRLWRFNTDIGIAFVTSGSGFGENAGTAMFAGYVGHPPELDATFTADGLDLQWPSSAIGWHLESRRSLDATDSWVELSTTANHLTVPLSESQRFFRLVSPDPAPSPK